MFFFGLGGCLLPGVPRTGVVIVTCTMLGTLEMERDMVECILFPFFSNG